MSLLLQISAGQGPAECQWVVERIVDRLWDETLQAGVEASLTSAHDGERPGLRRSVTLLLDGDGADLLARPWVGSILWVGESPFRPRHRRRNWFVGVEAHAIPAPTPFDERDVRIDTYRASGSGGQHLNKVSSAIRVTHLLTGAIAICEDERSQVRNKAIALQRLQLVLATVDQKAAARARRERRAQHLVLERGNPVRTFYGAGFVER